MADWDVVRERGGIRFSDTLTEAAKPKNEYEAHAHHEEMEIYWFLDGDLAFAFEGERYPIAPGDMVVICNGTLHRPVLKSTCRYERRRLLIKKELLSEYCPGGVALYRKLRSRQILRINREVVLQSGLDKLFADTAESLKDETALGYFRGVTALCYFLVTADRVCAPAEKEAQTALQGNTQELLRYIEDHLTEDLTYQTLSEYMHLSVKSLYQFFKQETGFPLGQYIKERRIIKAKTLLNAGIPAGEAAGMAGFKDYSVFYRSFTRETGMTPRQYAAGQKESR